VKGFSLLLSKEADRNISETPRDFIKPIYILFRFVIILVKSKSVSNYVLRIYE